MFALDGQVQIHDPSTIMQCDGKYYTYGTGGTTLVSDDGWLRTLDGQGIPSIETPAPLLLGGECQSVPPSTSLALDEQAGLRAHVEPS